MTNLGGWEVMEPPLGKGGQGTVYKARSPQRTAVTAKSRSQLRDAITRITNIDRISPRPDENAELDQLISSIRELVRPDDISSELGALKLFDIPADGSPEARAAAHRFEREVEALKSIQHPGILKLIAANVDEKWLVTEYHPGGSLGTDRNRTRFRGDVLTALQAFRSIVEAVARLHQQGYVHRDIKSNNVFVASDGRLVLGDFGIVFLEEQDRTRLTEEFERVGSRDWMAPWAHIGARVDDVKPTFDIFPLGKLLWVMISGQRILPPYYTHKDPKFSLEEMFPGRPGIEQVNAILDKCVVTDERNCLENAAPLKQMVDEAIEALGQTATLEQITLAAPGGGDFRVRISLTRFQLVATPLRRNEKGEWVAQQGAEGLLSSRWQMQSNGTFVRIG
jgi:serine/threonine protein kinase